MESARKLRIVISLVPRYFNNTARSAMSYIRSSAVTFDLTKDAKTQ